MNTIQDTDRDNEAGLKNANATDDDCGPSVDPCKGKGGGCAEILHGLNNVLASMLLNAQVMEWKLPSYSRSKRYLHEIERNAQRGGELVKRLLEQLEVDRRGSLCSRRTHTEIVSGNGASGTVAAQEQGGPSQVAELPARSTGHTAVVFLAHHKKAPHTIV
ncbi:MAG TPA: hypothetical protein VII23_07825 [Terriglobales bacterium]